MSDTQKRHDLGVTEDSGNEEEKNDEATKENTKDEDKEVIEPSPKKSREKKKSKKEDKVKEENGDEKRTKDRKKRDRSRTRSKSPELKRKRKERRMEEGGDEHKKSSRRKDKERKEHRDSKAAGDENAIEDGEVVEPPPPPKVLTAREIERQKLIEERLKNGLLDEEDEDKPVWGFGKAQSEKDTRACPYLDTIDRSVLDFDFEKLCSISMSTLNIYACMVCGKYFQGRGTNTHAYMHALDIDHRVYLNLLTLKFYCLPDNYEIIDPSLEDIKYVLKPTYSKEMIKVLDKQTKMARAYDDSTYYPGVVGLNNIKANDYCNVILHMLSHVSPLRDFFLREENYMSISRPPGDTQFELPMRYGELVRKLWNPKAFRKHVSPHEMLQATVLCSEKRFQFIKQGDAAEFMNFLLNTLHTALNGTQKTSSSIIYRTFRGRMRQYSRKIIPAETDDATRRQLLNMPDYQETSKDLPFLYLTLDLPPAPLYRDEQLQNIIPQVPLHVLMGKFCGTVEKEYKTYNENIMKRFELLRLPEYLIISYKRFHKNQWFIEKNPTIVNFPITDVDFYDCLAPEMRDQHKYTTYDLIANVVHDGTAKDGHYRIQLLHSGSGKWFEMEDLHVSEVLPQMIVLAESYIQVWRLNKNVTREQKMKDAQATMETS